MTLQEIRRSWVPNKRLIVALSLVIVVLLTYLLHPHQKKTTPKNTYKPTTRNCTGYYELRNINFKDYRIKSRLCEDFMAYSTADGKYPLCQLSSQLPMEIERVVSREAIKTYMLNKITGNNVTILGYDGNEAITNEIAILHTYESDETISLVKILKTLPKDEVTFLDVGCNIGAYSLIAADAGFPTVAADANIRNLVRMQLAKRDMGWSDDRLRIVWAFFYPQVGLRNLDFNLNGCNVGGAFAGSGEGGGVSQGSLKDTVPVMTATADDLLPQLRTRMVVMKIDVENSERIFFENSRRFLEEKNVVVVQMEWWRLDSQKPASNSPNHRFLVDYFVKRNYALLATLTLKTLDPETFTEWDTLWVKRDFVDIVRKSLLK